MKDEKEKSLLMDHDYDGIQELDHPLPGWWKATFYLCILFAIGYFFHYIVLDGPSLKHTYNIDANELKEIRRNYLQQLAQFKSDQYMKISSSEDLIYYGEDLFNTHCMSCHKAGGAGDIGPNLADEYWLYAQGTPETVFPFLIKGNPAAGMPAWGEYLSEDQIYSLTAYVMSLQGSNPANAKEAEGDHYPLEN
jgi:cytochrome c oxidase cbb3-type subunit 3